MASQKRSQFGVKAMFSDPIARSIWRRFLLRAELTMSAVSANVRRELLEDLTAQVREIVAHDVSNASEAQKVAAALARVGDPHEFLAPLLADAVFRSPSLEVGPAQALRALAATVSRGSTRAASAGATLLAGGLAALFLLIGIGSLLRPESIGVFSLGPDDIQLRLFGGRGGSAVFAPWLAIGLVVGGLVIASRAAAAARRIVLELLAGETPK
jgi:hypothetical protein